MSLAIFRSEPASTVKAPLVTAKRSWPTEGLELYRTLPKGRPQAAGSAAATGLTKAGGGV